MKQVCTGCGEDKPYAEFHKLAKGGFRKKCKACVEIVAAEYRARTKERKAAYDAARYAEKQDEIRQYQADYRARVGEDEMRRRRKERYYRNIEAERAQTLASYYKHRDVRMARNRAYYYANRESAYRNTVEWRERNRDKYREYMRRASDRRRGTPTTELGSEYAKTLRRDPCSYCGGPVSGVDHIVPMVRGGSGDWDNLTACCRSCNSRKNAKPMLLFLAEGGMVNA